MSPGGTHLHKWTRTDRTRVIRHSRIGNIAQYNEQQNQLDTPGLDLRLTGYNGI